MAKAVEYRRDGAISWITLNRPERLNAMNHALVRDLSAALDAVDADPDSHVIILHGEGRAFCSGDDLKDLEAQTVSDEATTAWVEEIQHVTDQIMGSRQIVIAAVHGWCVGGALEWAINCDFRLFAENTRWFFPEVGYGFFFTGGVSALLTKHIGPQRAKELLILGERHDARKALECGIAGWVVPDAELLAEAEKLACRIAEKPGATVADAKRAINQGFHASLAEAMAYETDATVRGFLNAEAQARASRD